MKFLKNHREVGFYIFNKLVRKKKQKKKKTVFLNNQKAKQKHNKVRMSDEINQHM